MSIVNIASQTDSSKIAGVFANGALKTQGGFTYAALSSASATGTVFSGAGVLHSIIIGNTATAGTMLWLFDCDGATAGAVGVSASAVARFDLTSAVRGSYLYDAIINGGLRYRLSGAEGLDNVTITYASGSFTS